MPKSTKSKKSKTTKRKALLKGIEVGLEALKVFCATGAGGGRDPSCGRDGSGGAGKHPPRGSSGGGASGGGGVGGSSGEGSSLTKKLRKLTEGQVELGAVHPVDRERISRAQKLREGHGAQSGGPGISKMLQPLEKGTHGNPGQEGFAMSSGNHGKALDAAQVAQFAKSVKKGSKIYALQRGKNPLKDYELEDIAEEGLGAGMRLIEDGGKFYEATFRVGTVGAISSGSGGTRIRFARGSLAGSDIMEKPPTNSTSLIYEVGLL